MKKKKIALDVVKIHDLTTLFIDLATSALLKLRNIVETKIINHEMSMI